MKHVARSTDEISTIFVNLFCLLSFWFGRKCQEETLTIVVDLKDNGRSRYNGLRQAKQYCLKSMAQNEFVNNALFHTL